MFGASNIAKNSDKDKWAYSGHGIAFDGKGSWGFGNDFSRNVVIFGVDNSSSSHFDKSKNNYLILGESPTSDINASFDSAEKTFSINFTKANTNFCSRLHYNGDNTYLFFNGKEICKVRADNKNVHSFFSGSISNKLDHIDFREVSLTRNVIFQLITMLLINLAPAY